MRTVDRGTGDAHSMESRLHDGVLLGMETAAQFMALPG